MRVAVVVATKNRGRLLAERSLPSLIAQTYTPEYLIVVDDSCSSNRPQNRSLLGAMSPFIAGTTVYLENKRTAGASGCWNTAIDYLFREVDNSKSLFIAILDDDDVWKPTYLEECISKASEESLDMIATDFYRIEDFKKSPILNQAPQALSANDFLIGNPGIQGSNLFVRLSVILSAGGFDEELRSTTDRDLCIRIADLGSVRYGRLARTLVEHFAETGRGRLSLRGSNAKHEGLSAFWRKYSGRMSNNQKNHFRERAMTLFDWSAQTNDDASFPPSQQLQSAPATDDHTLKHQAFPLYVGVISSDPSMIKPLLSDIASLRSLSYISDLAVIVLDNGSSAQLMQQVIHEIKRTGLQVALVSESKQCVDAANGAFGAEFHERPRGQLGIAQARTMLQRYLGTLLQLTPNAIGWMLDDDMRLDDRAREYLSWLPSLKGEGVDVLLGHYEGASPNPPLNGVRVHLVDLFHNLVWLNALDPDQPLSDRGQENQAFRLKFPDYYYDLSRKHTGHLEMPYWLVPAHKGETVGEARSRLIDGALGILSGAPLTRPIIAPASPQDPRASAIESVNRGGCTFFLNHRSLTLTPNTIVYFGGREARRSDMIWAITNRYYHGLTVKSVAFPVQHLGRVTHLPALNLEKVQGEILGSTLYAGLMEFLHEEPNHKLDFSDHEIQRICVLIQEHLARRLHALELNFHRIRGVGKSIRNLSNSNELKSLLSYIDQWFHLDVFSEIDVCLQTESIMEELATFLSSLRHSSDEYADGTVDVGFIKDQFSK